MDPSKSHHIPFAEAQIGASPQKIASPPRFPTVSSVFGIRKLSNPVEALGWVAKGVDGVKKLGRRDGRRALDSYGESCVRANISSVQSGSKNLYDLKPHGATLASCSSSRKSSITSFFRDQKLSAPSDAIKWVGKQVLGVKKLRKGSVGHKEAEYPWEQREPSTVKELYTLSKKEEIDILHISIPKPTKEVSKIPEDTDITRLHEELVRGYLVARGPPIYDWSTNTTPPAPKG